MFRKRYFEEKEKEEVFLKRLSSAVFVSHQRQTYLHYIEIFSQLHTVHITKSSYKLGLSFSRRGCLQSGKSHLVVLLDCVFIT